MKIRLLNITLFLFLFSTIGYSQDSVAKMENISDHKVDLSLDLKTMNVFRGLFPSAAPTLSTNIGFNWGNWRFGMYGGVGVDGRYRETDLNIKYSQNRYSVEFEYFYNYTYGITDIPDPGSIFDFNRQTMRGVFDLIVQVQLDRAGKWNLKSSTLVAGRDADIESITEGDEITTRRGRHRYSQYLELDYTWEWDEYKLKAHVGGAFSWVNPNGSHFYGNTPGFNNIGLTVSRNLKINNNISLPIKVSSYNNIISGQSYLVFSVNLLNF